MFDCRFKTADALTWGFGTIGNHAINNRLIPGPAPCRAPVRLAGRGCGFLEFPTSLCRHGFHLVRCGRACGNSCRRPAAHRTGVVVLAALPPRCTDSCCQSLRSTSLGLSLKTRFEVFITADVEQCVPQNTANSQACPDLFCHCL